MQDKLTLESAIIISTACHEDQKDKSGMPYILHPLRVMIAMHTNEERIVAVLHDVIEDCDDIDINDLREAGFSNNVIEAIDAISKRKDETYRHYIERVSKNIIATRVKIADLQDNLSPIRIMGIPEDQINSLHKRYVESLRYLTYAELGIFKEYKKE